MEDDRQHIVEQTLQDCLDSILDGRVTMASALAMHPDLAVELRPRLEAAVWLNRQRIELEPSPGFVETSRQRLMTRIQRDSVAAFEAVGRAPKGINNRTRQATGWWERWRLATKGLRFALALILLIVLLTGARGGAFASQSALPGETLYPLKISIEKAALAVSRTEAGQAQLHIRFAERRVAEIQALVLESKYGPIQEAALNFDAQIEQAIRSVENLSEQNMTSGFALTKMLEESLSKQRAVLTQLVDAAPADVGLTIQQAIAVSENGEARIDQIRSLVGDDSGTTPMPTATWLAVLTDGSPGSPTPISTDAQRAQTGLPAITNTQPPTSAHATLIEPSKTPTKTPDPTHAHEPSRTPNPTHAHDPSRTPDPTHAHDPSRTPYPTHEHEPSRTPYPTHEHDPSRTPDPTHEH